MTGTRAILIALVVGFWPALGSGADAGVDRGIDAGTDAAVPDVAPPPPSIPADRLPTLSLSVAPKEAAVGELIQWNLKVKRRSGDRVHVLSGASFSGLEVHSKEVQQIGTDGEWVEEIFSIKLIGFEPGQVEVGAQKLTVVDEQGRVAELTTDGATVEIKSLIANEPEPELKPDTGPGEAVIEKNYTLLWILGILAGVGLVALLTLIARKLWAMRKPKPGPPPPPPRPAEEIALEKLTALKESTLLDEGQVKVFHIRLSETIREYVGNRYGFDSLELSTEELVVELRNRKIAALMFDSIIEFLNETDLVKFAKLIPTLDESRGLLRQGFAVVEHTTPQPAVTTTAPTKDEDAAPTKGADDA